MDFLKRYTELNHIVLDLLNEHAAADENINYSIFSIMTLLAITAQATAANTRSEVVQALIKSDDYEYLIANVQNLQKILSDNQVFQSANAVLIQQSMHDDIMPDYAELLKNTFDADLLISHNMAEDVNDWVSQKTSGMIPQIADESMNHMLACMLNAVIFDDAWKEPYEEDRIQRELFTNYSNSNSTVQMMNSIESAYIENDSFTGFVKPYRNSFSFIGLLPKNKYNSVFEKVLKDIDIMELYQQRSKETVYVSIPEFQITFGKDISRLCRSMGIHMLFTPKADFSPMVSEQLMLGQIIHKTKIEVNRKGTKAAAVTAGVLYLGSIPFLNHKEVCLNRPFVYAIVENRTGIPVFTGVVKHLQSVCNI